jgi:hypothetical protein
MYTIKNLIILLLIVFLGSCTTSNVAVRSDYDRQANFRAYSTYAIVADKQKSNDPILGSELNQKRFAQALNIEMKARGYTPVEEDADLLISFQTDAKDKQYTVNNNNWGYWRWYGNNTAQTRQYEENRIIINMVDAKTKELVWQGWAVGQLNDRKKDRDTIFREVVYRIMQEYPHRAGGQISNNTTRNR